MESLFFNLELRKHGGSTWSSKGTLIKKKDIDNLKIEHPFVKEVVEIWSEGTFL